MIKGAGTHTGHVVDVLRRIGRLSPGDWWRGEELAAVVNIHHASVCRILLALRKRGWLEERREGPKRWYRLRQLSE